jgi:hypothetical protein
VASTAIRLPEVLPKLTTAVSAVTTAVNCYREAELDFGDGKGLANQQGVLDLFFAIRQRAAYNWLSDSHHVEVAVSCCLTHCHCRCHGCCINRYCYRQAELGIGDCGGLRLIPGMTKSGKQETPEWLQKVLGVEVPKVENQGKTLEDLLGPRPLN